MTKELLRKLNKKLKTGTLMQISSESGISYTTLWRMIKKKNTNVRHWERLEKYLLKK